LIAPRLRSKLKGIVELRDHNWVPRRAEEVPKTIKDIHDNEKKQSKGKEQKLPPPSPKTQQKESLLKIIGRGKSSTNIKNENPWLSQPRITRNRHTTQNSPRLTKSDSGIDLLDRTENLSKSSQDIKRILTTDSQDSQDSPLEERPPLSRGNSYSDEEIISKTKNILSDYMEEESTEDAVDRLKRFLTSPSAPSVMISNILSFAFEKKENQRQLISELLASLSTWITMKDFEKAFDELLSLLSDLIYDIPKAGEYMGYFLAQAIISKCISCSFLGPDILIEYKISPNIAEGLLGQCFQTINLKDTLLLNTIYLPFMENIQNFLKDGKKERFFNSIKIEEKNIIQTPDNNNNNPTPQSSNPKESEPQASPHSPAGELSDQSNNHIRPRGILSTASDFIPPDDLQKFKLPRGRGTKIK